MPPVVAFHRGKRVVRSDVQDVSSVRTGSPARFCRTVPHCAVAMPERAVSARRTGGKDFAMPASALRTLYCWRVPTALPPGLLRQVVRFAGIGVLSTLAYLLLYVLLREPDRKST